jgi:hypothetical protein
MSVTPPAAVVLIRLDLERSRLARIQDLRRTGPAAELVEEFAGDRLNALVTDLRGQLDRLATKAAKRVNGATFGDLAELQHAVDRAAGEALGLAMGALARQAGLDDNACEEADLLVKWLARRLDRRFARPTMPGDEEAVHRATDVIHRRVPDHGLWDLPVMAHEFGHLAASGLGSWDARDNQVLRPVESWLDNFHGKGRSQATELFCDVFATYSMGPSYLCALVFHRLCPVADARAFDDGSHPSDPSRVYACQWTLRRMRGSEIALHPFDRPCTLASTAWESMQAAAPANARLTKDMQADLNTQLVGCWVAVTTNLSSLAYQWSWIIRDLVSYLESPVAPDMPDGFSPADALNAAWLVRLDSWFEGRAQPGGMEDRARRLIRQSLAEARHGH